MDFFMTIFSPLGPYMKKSNIETASKRSLLIQMALIFTKLTFLFTSLLFNYILITYLHNTLFHKTEIHNHITLS
jgi:hypothetical protein